MMDTMKNRYMVGKITGQDRIVIMMPVPQQMNRKQALNLAAWLAAVADDGSFDELLTAVRNT